MAEGRGHVDVEAVVDEDEFGFAGGEAPDEDVSWVRVAVDPAPEEHLGGEEVDHCGHYFGEMEAQSAFALGAFPGISAGLDLLVLEGGAR